MTSSKTVRLRYHGNLCTAYPGCAGLARSPIVLTEHISSYIAMEKYCSSVTGIALVPAALALISERAKRASSVMFVFNRDFRYAHIYISYYIDTEKYHESVTVYLRECRRHECNTRN